jgi:hypothetical protein
MPVAAQQQGPAPILVEAVEYRPGDGQHLVVVAGEHRQAPADDVEAGGFGGIEAFVGQVGLVDRFGQFP